ncbi:ribonuclease III [Candidatus Falkowbacteria bacterium RIFOXYD2_FULL_35_9]|uniref:Ribonuclease 3 n=1 Tax=Candidatus Falkowbacteria bacterium RIFOXYC2_FULL_36_12 TaxID=1798002 RepID=A0A1F5T390_9BACT|nr:MAG: ribonuclease III [Candidatus Falkowbacteria bacterium RIFOXYB2_FULL_35_7]OGF33427.1 MAG: ribonuclease III [Candidatus Falkowbacteria bacterium RIFOXYC2_FULL_36_12]OGF33922.1 MAG: ribonuclease III [Candidatus Falkowbacteria bacterium RIFOXYA2_FULL_35_8]OGF45789.1 MAG: ribonuclease III [Candidatus Falkowbacteria bacterium RIFOXYD2_FULL_35_9]
MEKDLIKFQKGIKVKFDNENLLQQAFVHRSYLNEHRNFPLDQNERLEFLGDAVLELVVTEYLYLQYNNPEGELTNWRASLVNSKMLSKIANKLKIDKYLYLSKGEQKDTGKARNFILANAVEALIGAIYLDQGWETAKIFVENFILTELPEILEKRLFVDPKTRFQEMAQEKEGITPNYKVVEESGPDHEKTFKVGVYLEKVLVAEGDGSSKQEAQEDAARNALEIKNWV